MKQEKPLKEKIRRKGGSGCVGKEASGSGKQVNRR
jgi:hypothetical protein